MSFQARYESFCEQKSKGWFRKEFVKSQTCFRESKDDDLLEHNDSAAV